MADVRHQTSDPRPESSSPTHFLPHSLLTDRGQALLELAIFGSLLLLLLGALLNYGLNAEYNQQVMMESFRKALGIAAGQGTGAAAVIRDNPLPNPSNPFAVGSVLPVAASANVTKNFQMAKGGGGSSKLLLDLNDTIDVATTTSSDGTIREFTVATVSNLCDAEILSFDLIKKECKVLSALKEQCELEFAQCELEFEECELLELESCTPCTPCTSLPWCCSKIDQLFDGIREMGLQPGGVRASDLNATLDKTESPPRIDTTQHVDWQDQMTRTIVTRPLGDESGTAKTETITVTPKDQDTTTTWSTPWN